MTSSPNGAPPASVPMFQQPPPINQATAGPGPAASRRETVELPLMEERDRRPESPGKVGLRERAESLLGRGTHTGTSLADGPAKPYTAAAAERERKAFQVDAELVTAAAGALAGVFVLAGAWAVRARYRGARKLRQPTDADLRSFGKPVGSLMMRRAGMAKWGIDILETLTALGAVGQYLNDGPLTVPVEAGTDIFGNED